MNDDREQAHQLIDRLPETQLSALVGLLETIVDPVAAALRNAPIDDEPETEEEQEAVAEARDWLARPEYRLRVGDWRVRSHRDGETVRVLRRSMETPVTEIGLPAKL